MTGLDRISRCGVLALMVFALAAFDLDDLVARAKHGDPKAQTELGGLYEIGEHVEENDITASQWYRRAAEQGYAEAQAALGMLYLEGNGVNWDYKQAKEWLGKSADQNNRNAQFGFGLMYYRAEQLVPKDYEKAAYWFDKAASQNHLKALLALSYMHRDGRGVGQDANRANELRDQAIEAIREKYKGPMEVPIEHLIAAYFLPPTSSPYPVDYAEAAKWIKIAAKNGFVVGQDLLGALYQHGKGVPRNFELAAKWYRKAGLKGLDSARQSYCKLYREEQSLPKDAPLFAEWCR